MIDIRVVVCTCAPHITTRALSAMLSFPCPPYFQSTLCQPSQKHEASFAADELIIEETLLLVWPLHGAGNMDDFRSIFSTLPVPDYRHLLIFFLNARNTPTNPIRGTIDGDILSMAFRKFRKFHARKSAVLTIQTIASEIKQMRG